MIEALEHEHVVQLAAGGWHCVAITNEGKMYAWGGNEYFQCGVGAGALRAQLMGRWCVRNARSSLLGERLGRYGAKYGARAK